MRNYLVILLCVYSTALNAQKYLTLELTPETSTHSCDASLKILSNNLTGPFQINVYNDVVRGYIGYGDEVFGLCGGDKLTIELMDSSCVAMKYYITLDTFGGNQIFPDTIIY